MRRSFIRIAFLFSALAFCVTALAKDNSISTKVSRDVQVVHSTASFHLNQIVPQTRYSWVIAEIVPGLGSGNGITEPEYLAPPTGSKAVVQKSISGILLTQINGSLKILANLTQAPHQDVLSYDWASVVNIHESFGGLLQDHDTPFIVGGTVIGSINGNHEHGYRCKANDFGQFYRIPKEWQPYVLPAFKFYKTNRALFETTAAHGSKPAFSASCLLQLRKLLTSDNPFLADEACRTLAETGNLDSTLAKSLIIRSQGLRQAVLTYLVFKNMPQASRSNLSDAVSAVVGSAGSSSQIQGIALAANAAMFDTFPYVASPVSDLLKQLDQKQQSFHTDTPADTYVNAILVNTRTRAGT